MGHCQPNNKKVSGEILSGQAWAVERSECPQEKMVGAK